VTVAEHIYEQQGVKVVMTSDGQVREVPAGQRPEPTEEVLTRAGEPSFQVRLAHVVRSDDDLSDGMGLALRRVAQRLYQVMSDGREVPGEEGPVEWNVGAAVHDGAVVMYLDTDGSGFGRAMVDTMVGVFVEELAPLAVHADISAATASPSDKRAGVAEQ
jgi:hypothetical protein